MYHYHLYGLDIDSELEIPELRSTRARSSDLSIRFGEIEDELPGAIRPVRWLQHAGNECLMTVAGVGRFLIREGREIIIDRRVDRSRDRGQGAPISDVRLYVLGSAFGALLHQRGELPMHVSAVDSGSGVWAFTGPSGAGKSTMAAWFHRSMGWPIISDDVSVIRPSDPGPILYPGPRKLKLWSDAIDHLGCRDADLRRDLSNTEKYQLFLDEQDCPRASRLKALIVLERGEQEPVLERLTGIEAFRVCRRSVYRPLFETCFRKRSDFIRDVVDLANRIEVYRFRRNWSLDAMSEHFDVLDAVIGRNRLSEVG
jgi:hypothetical protein